MNKKTVLLVLFILLSFNAFTDSGILQLYMQRFSAADLSAKVQIMENAAGDISLKPYIGYFYGNVLHFALVNLHVSELRESQYLLKIIDFAARGLASAGRQNTNHNANLENLWNLFLEFQDSVIAAELVITMGKLGAENSFIIDNINNFLLEKNEMYLAGYNVNYALISACISAILELGSSSSYPVLFSILSSGFPEIIAFEAQGAMELIPGNFKQFLYDIIKNNPPFEKFVAFRTGNASRTLSIADKGRLAELALEQSLIICDSELSPAEIADLSAMRFASVLTLTNLQWTRANSLAIKHFYRVQAEFRQDIVPRNRFIEAVNLLGAVGASDAALILGMHLNLINTHTERTGKFDEEITLAIVQALGSIGDISAFNHLLDIANLPYPEKIKFAAREAIARLRW